MYLYFLPSFDSVIQTNTNEKRSAMSFKRLQGGRLSSFACTGKEPSFTLSPTLFLSLFPVQVSIRFVTSYENGCATYGNDYAKPLKRLCRVLGTVVPLRWHSRAKGVAQACQRGGTSKAYLLLLVRYAFSALQAYLQRDSLSNSQAGITV